MKLSRRMNERRGKETKETKIGSRKMTNNSDYRHVTLTIHEKRARVRMNWLK